MDDSIINFLQHQSVVTICCTEEDGSPYCFPCFFAFNAAQGLLYFKSSPKSYHASIIAKNPGIAGCILPDKLNVLALKGVQFEGNVLPAGHEMQRRSSVNYYSKYPQALMIPGEIYVIQLTNIKMTDGAKGFGKKITWQRQVA
jgi:uncharacterized protein YhbP (UPF0306 family)